MEKNPTSKVTVTGYADKETGNSEYQYDFVGEVMQKNVVEALKAKGIAAIRIITSYKRDTVQPYQKPENRVCICIAE